MGKFALPPLAAFLFLALCVLPAAAAPSGQAVAPAYMALGDSLAFGVGVPDPSSSGYVALVHDALRGSERYREVGLDLVNLASPGATSSDLVAPGGQLDAAITEIGRRQEAGASSAEKVEIISIDIGGNDLLALATRDSPCIKDPSGDACRERLGQTLSALQRNLTETLRRLREAAPEAVIFAIDLYNPYSGTGNSLEGIADLGVQELNGVTGAVTADPGLGVKMVDVYELFRGRGRQWIAADGIHPNENGHKVIAEVLLAAIDNRQPAIPAALLAETPAATIDPSLASNKDGLDSGGIDDLVLLAIAVPIAFAAGVLLTAGYFLARGRRDAES